MKKEKNIITDLYHLKENIKMGKEMVKVKNMIVLVIYFLKENMKMEEKD